MSRAEVARKGASRRTAAAGGVPMRRNAANSPLLWRAQRDVIRQNNRPPEPPEEADNQGRLPDARDDRFRREYQPKDRAGHGLVHSACGYRRQPARTVQDRFLLAVFRPAAQGRSRALLQGQHVRAVLVGDQIQRHHGHRDQSFGVLVGGIAWRHHRSRRRARPASRKLHRHGSAAPCRAAQDRGADVHADPSRPARDQHPQAVGRMPRQSAEERSVRLGRPGLDRADHADARRAVRLPLGGPPQADALVRHRNNASRSRTAWSRRKTSGRPNCWNARAISASSGKSASISRRRATCCR